VINTVGVRTSSAATLTVNAAPVAPSITTQPTSQTAAAGQSATFNVAATGTAPLSYQWRKNSVAITGADLVYLYHAGHNQLRQRAQFTVVVINTVGSATSSAARSR